MFCFYNFLQMLRNSKRRKQLTESAKRARLSRLENDDDLPALKHFDDSSDSDDSDDDSDDENFVSTKVVRHQTIISLFKKQLSKLENEAQKFVAEILSDHEEVDKHVEDNGLDKPVAVASATSVSSTNLRPATPRVPASTVKLRLRLFNQVLPQDLCLNSRWDKSRRARTDGHQSLGESTFSRYKSRGHQGGRPRVCPNLNLSFPNERARNRLINRQRTQDAAAEVSRKRQEKKRTFQQCVDVLNRAWQQPTLAGRFKTVYRPDAQETTVCA